MGDGPARHRRSDTVGLGDRQVRLPRQHRITVGGRVVPGVRVNDRCADARRVG